MVTGTALITGTRGFVGRRLATHLSEQGWQVRGSDAVEGSGADYRACDLREAGGVAALLDWAMPLTHVFHLAAVTFVPESVADPAMTFDVNLCGTVNLVKSLAAVCPDARLIFVGSSEAYGAPQYLPQDEDHPLNPQNPYAISKAAADQYCAYAAAEHGLDIVRLRPYNHSGPGQSDRFVLPSFAKQAAEIALGRRDPAIHVGNLDVARDFLHVDDVVRAYEAVACDGEAGEAYNVCSGNAVPLRQVVDWLRDAAGVPIETQVDSDRYRPAKIPEVRGSHAKLSAVTGWRPEKDDRELVQDLFAYWKQRTASD